MSLVIVESPAKCAKIQSYLGEGYVVKATMGHIRALEESLDSVGIETNWTPKYEEIATKKDAIKALRAAAKSASRIILATDDDREGEGIAWHVCFLLKLNPATTPRIVFHEITKTAIQLAVAQPRFLDLNKVYAQQARAMLDLLVGFTISRVLWSRVAPKLSAGRCQTPALRLVVERDVEIERHTAASFWKLQGEWAPHNLNATANKEYTTEEDVTKVLQKVHADSTSKITLVKESVSTSSPPKPLITSTLQQEASSLYGLAPKTTMLAAQKLYEMGHITYMRTDNAVLSEEATVAIQALITTRYGETFVGNSEKPKTSKRSNKSATNAQEAHEAIRPTHPEDEPTISEPIQKKVYSLIWRRTLQSQMAPCKTDVRKITIEINKDTETQYVAEQTKQNFLGWRILENNDPEKATAEVSAWNAWTPKVGDTLHWKSLQALEQFTKPKGRYTEASLIAELEKRGIGRPSTFATLVGTILEREYVEKTNVEGATQESKIYALAPRIWPPKRSVETHKVGAEKNKVRSTALGRSVSDFLSREYSDLFNYDFTASMESDLDEISKGTKSWKSLLQTTWDIYKDRYNATLSATPAVAKAARERDLGDGIKVILSRKGPLFVREGTPKATFAQLPTGKTFETATKEDAITSFATPVGEEIGIHEAEPILKKKGPYGYYFQWKTLKIPAKPETLEETIVRLEAKANPENSYNRIVGEFTIRRGPYGLYFYKTALKKKVFRKLVSETPDTVTEAELRTEYAKPVVKRRIPKKKGKSDS